MPRGDATTEARMALRDFNRTMMLPMRVWDAPTRLFHWSIVLLVPLSFVSAEADWMRMHLVSGYIVLALLLFRLVWGFVGSETARFRQFLVSPVKGLRHLRTIRQPTPDTQIGHNEAGGWMVLIMLLLLGVQAVSGLFNTEEYGKAYAAAGPLVNYVGKQTASLAGAVHAINFNLLAAVIVLHILAIGAYARLKQHDLVRPMITGVKRLPAATRQPCLVGPRRAALVLAVAGAAVWVLATQF
jgi:cytochrome b